MDTACSATGSEGNTPVVGGATESGFRRETLSDKVTDREKEAELFDGSKGGADLFNDGTGGPGLSDNGKREADVYDDGKGEADLYDDEIGGSDL